MGKKQYRSALGRGKKGGGRRELSKRNQRGKAKNKIIKHLKREKKKIKRFTAKKKRKEKKKPHGVEMGHVQPSWKNKGSSKPKKRVQTEGETRHNYHGPEMCGVKKGKKNTAQPGYGVKKKSKRKT